jgi:DNA replication protein DnaC
MNVDQLNDLAYELRLYGVKNGFKSRAEEAQSKGLHPLEFLRLILEDEKINRKDRLSKSLLTRAKFRSQADLEDWDTTYDRGLSKQNLRDLGQLGFYNNRENLIIMGRTGEGKTHLAIALGRRLCQESSSVAFLSVNFMFEEVMAAKAAGKYLGYIRKLNQTKILIMDDFGLRAYTHDEATILIDILEDRSKKGPIIVTSQVSPEGWGRLFEDPVIGEGILDRMIHPSQKVILKGGSYREKLGRNSARKIS